MSFDKDTLRRDRQVLFDELTQVGAKFKGNYCTCPYHDDKRASAGIYCKDGVWRFKCQVCDAGGDIFDIQAKNEGKAVAEVLRDKGKTDLKPTGRAYQPQSMTFDSMDAIRGFLKANVGTIVSEHRYTDSTGEKLLQTIFRCEKNGEKTYRPCYPVNSHFVLSAVPKPRPLYNLPGIAEADTVVVVEGEKCVDTLGEYGIATTTSPGGAKNAHCTDWGPLTGKNVILWPDNDDEGIAYIKQVEGILQNLEPPARVSILDPALLDLQAKEDAYDFIEQLKVAGIEDIVGAIYKALGKAKSKGIAVSVGERIEAAIKGSIAAISWPWEWVTLLTKSLRPGSITLLCGSAGASKSFMLLQALAYWHNTEVKVVAYELEESREYHLQRALAQRSCMGDITDLDWIKDNPEKAREAYSDHREFLESFGRCLWASPESQPTLEQVADWIEAKAKAGYRIICADPVTAAIRAKEAYIVDPIFLRSVGNTAERYDCSVILVTHPIKAVSHPDMSQIAGSAAYTRHCQAILWLESHDSKTSKVKTPIGTTESEHNRTLHILKARDGKGTGFRLAYQFEAASLTLRELGIILKDNKK